MSVRRRYATLLLAICQLACWPVARYLHSASCPDHVCAVAVCPSRDCPAPDLASCSCERYGHGNPESRTGDGPGVGDGPVTASQNPDEPSEKSTPHSRSSCALCAELAKSSCLPPVFTAAAVVLPDAVVSQVSIRIPELAARMRFPARGPPV